MKKKVLLIKTTSILMLLLVVSLFTHCNNPNDAYVFEEPIVEGQVNLEVPDIDDSNILKTCQGESCKTTPPKSPDLQCMADLEISDFSLFQINKGIVTLKLNSSLNSTGELKVYAGVISESSLIKTISLNESEQFRTIVISDLPANTELIAVANLSSQSELAEENCGTSSQSIQFQVEEVQPDLICEADMVFNPETHEEINITVGGKDDLQGLEDAGIYEPTPIFMQQQPHPRKALFDETGGWDKVYYTEYDLSQYQSKMVCVSIKFKARVEHSLLSTDSVYAIAGPYNSNPYPSQEEVNFWKAQENQSYFGKALRATSTLYNTADIMIDIYQLTNHLDHRTGNRFIDKLNEHGGLRFFYQDDVTMDYIELKLIVLKN